MPDFPTPYQLKTSIKQFITLSEAAVVARRTPHQLRVLIRRGRLWGSKIGPNWVTTEVAVRDYLATNPRPGPKPKSPKNP